MSYRFIDLYVDEVRSCSGFDYIGIGLLVVYTVKI